MRPHFCAALLGVFLVPLRVGAQQYDIRVFGVEDGLPGSTVTAISQDSAGFLWVETDGGMCRFDGRSFQTWTAQEGALPREVDKEVGITDARGPVVLDDTNATCELTTADGDRWIGTEHGLRRRARGMEGTFSTLTELEGLGGNMVQCLFQDRSGIIWVGSRLGGLARYTSDAVVRFDEHSGLPGSKIVGFSAFPDGHMEIHTQNGSVALLTGSLRAVPTDRPAVDKRVVDPLDRIMLGDGHEWFAANNGVFDSRSDGTLLRVGRDSIPATALTMGTDSMFIGTYQGLYIAPLDNSAANWTRLFAAGDEEITCLTRDHVGNVWMGTATNGLVRYGKNGTQRWTTREKLSSDRIRQLLLDAYQNLWVGTDRGFDLLELDELQEEVIDISHFGLEDGFPGIDAMPNACMLDDDSALWFGTTRGAIRFDPRKVLEDPIAPHTRVTDLALFFERPDWRPWSERLDADGLPVGLTLPYDKNHLTFTFTGLSLAYPEKVRFQYRLEGHDADWSPITREDKVTFSGLEPGEYTFLVKARNGSGVWNDEPARFAFAITPPFWATTTFRVSGAGALLLGFFGFQRLRDRRARKARERLERIVATRTQELTEEKHRSDTLLLNILPETTAAELKERGSAQARSYTACTVLFSDFQGFTVLSEQFEATGIVTELDRFFRAFDRITDKFGTEKIKTIGDAYMCASGVPEPSPTHALDAVLMALEMLSVVDDINAQRVSEGHPAWPIRIGLNSGPLIAGVVGEKKFAYDVWGDTVNLASRMESNGAPGRVNVTGSVMRHVEAYVVSEARGQVNIKGKGAIESWFVDRLRPEYSADEQGRTANERLMALRNTLRAA